MPPAADRAAEARQVMRDLGRNLLGGLRLALLRPVRRDQLAATAEAFAVLMLVDLAALFLLDYAIVGSHGQFNFHELPRALLAVPLLLGLGMLVARANDDPPAMLALAVALLAAGVAMTAVVGVLGLVLQYRVAMAPVQWSYLNGLFYGWWAVVIGYAMYRIAPAGSRRTAGNIAAGLLMVLLPAWLLPQGHLWTPAYDAVADERWRAPALAEEKAFYAQHEALRRALSALKPGRPGVPDLYVIAAGLYADEDVFMKEVKAIETLFRERFDAEGRSLILVNNPKTVHEYPAATLTSLSAALRHVGKLMNPDEDVLFLYLSSHGSEQHRLSVDFRPLRLAAIDPPALKRALDESGIRYKVVVVSACYSGGFVEPLRDERTAVITASSATRQSFGCGTESDATYLAKALFDEALRETYSLEEAYEKARESIAARERSEGYTPSEPQMHMGAAVRARLARIEARLAASRPTLPADEGT